MSAAKTIHNGDQIKFTVDIPNTPGNSFDLFVNYWGQEVMERVSQFVGFQEINWLALQMSDEGLENYPINHWQAFLEKPYSIVLVCTK